MGKSGLYFVSNMLRRFWGRDGLFIYVDIGLWKMEELGVLAKEKILGLDLPLITPGG